MILEIFVIILLFALVFFHELGHKIIAGKDFITFKIGRFGWAIYCHSFTINFSIFQFLTYYISGWIFSLPVVILAYFISSFWFTTFLLTSMAISIADFFVFFIVLIQVFYYKIPFNRTIREVNQEAGLKRWKPG